MIATFRLSRHLPSFEFFYWLVQVQAAGASKIVIDASKPKLRKFTLDDLMERVRSIIEPGSALAGLPYRYGNDAGGLDATPAQLLSWWQSGKRFSRLRSPLPPTKGTYTVTIRANAAGAPARDSNADAWFRFAEYIGARVIPDYYSHPIHLHDRMALYAGAIMNFGVCNGPLAILGLTPYPLTMFVNSESAANSNLRAGLDHGGKYPWMLNNQRMEWRSDTFDDLRRVFDERIEFIARNPNTE